LIRKLLKPNDQNIKENYLKQIDDIIHNKDIDYLIKEYKFDIKGIIQKVEADITNII
jgi:hypothetical protein